MLNLLLLVLVQVITFSKIQDVKRHLKSTGVRSRFEGEHLVISNVTSWNDALLFIAWQDELYKVAIATHVMRQPYTPDYEAPQKHLCINCMKYNGHKCENTKKRTNMNGCPNFEKGRIGVV